jgi:hypothetical protein
MVAVRVTPLYVAETTDVAVAVTALVDTNVGSTLLFTPAGTVIVAGTVTTAGLLLENATTAPPLGAGAVSVTVADAVEPPTTVAGLTETELSAGAAVTVHPDSRALTGAAEPSFTSTVQSAGGVYPDRSTLKAPELVLTPICTPSTVIARFAVALPSIRNLSPLISARETVTAACAVLANPIDSITDSERSPTTTRLRRGAMSASTPGQNTSSPVGTDRAPCWFSRKAQFREAKV